MKCSRLLLLVVPLLASCTAAPIFPATATPTPTVTLTPSPTAIPTATVIPTPVPMSAFQAGVSYTPWKTEHQYSDTASDQTLEQVIKPLGVNWIAVVVTCYQDTMWSTEISCDKPNLNTATDAELVHVIQYAHNLGLRVMLKPHIDLAADPQHDRNWIDFGRDGAAWRAWFDSYTTFIAHYASLAEDTGADYLVIGTELASASYKAKEWRQVVETVRAAYHGPITYASNWYEEPLTWWDAVDSIGVDAYYPLTQINDPTQEQLNAAWAPIVRRLGLLARQWNKPIIFTEIGYRNIDGANVKPWEWKSGETVDLQEQADCYEAVFQALSGQPWWHGVFWWNWDVQPDQGGEGETDFTASGKPAEDVLRHYYGATPHPTPTPAPLCQIAAAPWCVTATTAATP
jgi:hypothetical protein